MFQILLYCVWIQSAFARVERDTLTIHQNINIGPVVPPHHLGSSGIYSHVEEHVASVENHLVQLEHKPTVHQLPHVNIVHELPAQIVHDLPVHQVHDLPVHQVHDPHYGQTVHLKTQIIEHKPPYVHKPPYNPPLKPHVPVYNPQPRYVADPPPAYEPVPHYPPHVPHHPHPPVHAPEHKKYRVPECAYSSKYNINNTFCLDDDYYPIDTIKYELNRNLPLLGRVLSDVAYQSADNLVDGLTKLEEEGYTYSHYYGDNNKQDSRNYQYAPEYYKRGGYICPSDIYYGRPKRAENTYGEWKVIVNLPEEYLAKGYGYEFSKFSQTQRLEQCLYPTLPCSYIHPAVHSNCLQKYTFVRLLAYSRTEGLHIDSFKLPSSCSCHVKDEVYYG